MHRLWRHPSRWLGVGLVATACLGAAQSVAPAQAAAPGPLTKIVGTVWGDLGLDLSSLDLYGRNDARKDAGSLYTVTRAIGARDLWASKDASGRAVTGRGVTVAVLDSGVAAVPGLNGAGKVVRGPDLSLEANSGTPLSYDTFGHGTHMASIIAGKDATVAVDAGTGAPRGDDPTKQIGVAPDASLLALKLASTDGSTDVSQVIAGLDWVTQHRNDNGMNVRVVNLSFGTASVQPYQVDPLATAAEHAWRAGIVVVVSGGNAGPASGGLTDPAIDPYVLAVGSSDPGGRTDGWQEKATVASYSSRGTAARHVDLLSPGRSIVGLRAPGSYVDLTHPEGRIVGDLSGRLFRGSGTSQAAAVTSGAVALLLQAYPQLTPDQVKAALVATATRLPGVDPLDGGAGTLNVKAAATAIAKALAAPAGTATLLTAKQTFPAADGTGSLEQARGGSHLVDPLTGAVLAGELDVQGQRWDGRTWAVGSLANRSWSGGTWNGARWSGDTWSAGGWTGARWSGSAWSGARWSDASWTSVRWSGARWSDVSWDGARWSGARWS